MSIKKVRQSIMKKDLEGLIKTLKNTDINQTDHYGNTALHLAYRYGNIEIINYLKSNGADVNIENANGMIPFFCLAFNKDVSLVDDLVKAGEDFNQRGIEFSDILFYTVFYGTDEMLRKLLEIGLNPNVIDSNKWTLLHLAARFRKDSKERILLDAGAVYNLKDDEGMLPLHNTAVNPNKEATEMLLVKDTSQVNEYDLNYNTPFYNALEHGSIEVVKIMSPYADVNKPGCMNQISLHYIISGLIDSTIWKIDMQNSRAAVDKLIDEAIEKIKIVKAKGADVKAKDINNRTALDEFMLFVRDFKDHEIEEIIELLS